MAIRAPGGTDFKPAPEGQFLAVCCDVVDLGWVESEYRGTTKNQPKIRVVFQIDEINPDDNKPYIVMQQFTLSMYEAAHLRKFLEQWRGRPYTEKELGETTDGGKTVGPDVDKMLNANALMQIVHNTKNGTTYANISSIMKAPRGSPRLEVRDYVKVRDRDDGQSDEPPPGDEDLGDDLEDNSLPF